MMWGSILVECCLHTRCCTLVSLVKADQTLYQEVLEEIFKDHHVGERAKARIQFMHQDLKKKGNTEIDIECSVFMLILLSFCF